MGRHKLDVASLIFGILFLALGLLLVSGSVLPAELKLSTVWPGLLVLAGLALFASAARRRREPPRPG